MRNKKAARRRLVLWTQVNFIIHNTAHSFKNYGLRLSVVGLRLVVCGCRLQRFLKYVIFPHVYAEIYYFHTQLCALIFAAGLRFAVVGWWLSVCGRALGPVAGAWAWRFCGSFGRFCFCRVFPCPC